MCMRLLPRTAWCHMWSVKHAPLHTLASEAYATAHTELQPQQAGRRRPPRSHTYGYERRCQAAQPRPRRVVQAWPEVQLFDSHNPFCWPMRNAATITRTAGGGRHLWGKAGFAAALPLHRRPALPARARWAPRQARRRAGRRPRQSGRAAAWRPAARPDAPPRAPARAACRPGPWLARARPAPRRTARRAAAPQASACPGAAGSLAARCPAAACRTWAAPGSRTALGPLAACAPAPAERGAGAGAACGMATSTGRHSHHPLY